jgi:hypothetical protein
MVNAGMVNRNEGRNYFDFSPVEGLDEFVVLENYIPLDQVGNQAKLKGGEPSTNENQSTDPNAQTTPNNE